MKRTIAWVAGMVIVAALVVFIVNATDKANADSPDVVGAWQVDAVGAPYVPHLFTFTGDGTMFTTNPTDVQENPAAPHGGTNDSVGMGAWRHDGRSIVGTFYELNAFADNHQPTDTLEVRFKITVSGDHLTGDWLIVAFDARGTFNGTRLVVKPWIPA
jgi:hypothetical protein